MVMHRLHGQRCAQQQRGRSECKPCARLLPALRLLCAGDEIGRWRVDLRVGLRIGLHFGG